MASLQLNDPNLDNFLKLEDKYFFENYNNEPNILNLHHNFIEYLNIHYLQKEKISLNLIKKITSVEIKSLDSRFPKIDKNILTLEIIEDLHIQFLNSHFINNNWGLTRISEKTSSKKLGSFYTDYSIVKNIVYSTVNDFQSELNDKDTKILDFGAGTGRFYFEVLDYLFHKKSTTTNNIYAIDKDAISLLILKTKLLKRFGNNSNYDIDLLLKNILCVDALNPDQIENKSLFVNTKNSFDIILSNPPYGNLKVNKKNNKYLESFIEQHKLETTELISKIRSSKVYKLANVGMLNLYKLSIERILYLLKPNGTAGIICPSTLFGDKSSISLRRELIINNKINRIILNQEKDKLFKNVTQATTIFTVTKNNITSKILFSNNSHEFTIDVRNIIKYFSDTLEIPYIKPIGWNILKKVSKFQKLKSNKNLRNRRGELDLTIGKKYISFSNTGFPLLRGNMIRNFPLNHDDIKEFVNIDEFLKTKSNEYKLFDFNKRRIVGHQISNMDQKRRLFFTICEPNFIVANSCNYISIHSSNEEDLISLKNLLNSKLVNWLFKITSTNNHVNNYELDEIPLLDFSQFGILKDASKPDFDKVILKLYGLNEKEIKYIIEEN